ncbi:MAG TPA: hypothetical protein VN821_16820 [Candidatus Udaeobacter sp.]|nr:hypothetical protein [Candidatus Udaeobacter sp.]
MTVHRFGASLLFGILLLALSAGAAEAQWVFLARKVIGRVESMQQKPEPDTPTYDVATVVLEANADKVYRTVIETVHAHPGNKIVNQDDLNRQLDVTNGKQTVGIHVFELQDKVSQLMIASAVKPGQQSPTSYAAQRVLAVCASMHVTCYMSGSAPP